MRTGIGDAVDGGTVLGGHQQQIDARSRDGDNLTGSNPRLGGDDDPLFGLSVKDARNEFLGGRYDTSKALGFAATAAATASTTRGWFRFFICKFVFGPLNLFLAFLSRLINSLLGLDLPSDNVLRGTSCNHRRRGNFQFCEVLFSLSLFLPLLDCESEFLSILLLLFFPEFILSHSLEFENLLLLSDLPLLEEVFHACNDISFLVIVILLAFLFPSLPFLLRFYLHSFLLLLG
mmetsp:Transcript_12118/g.25014  ORF Transcript_12118/g.25014 Transcript_12118/m.25014 type:complete len:233 (-) Transcript_12118:666-1364(-)